LISPHAVVVGEAVGITLLGFGDYAWRVYRGRVAPDRMSWLMWAIGPMVVAAVECRNGDLGSALVAFALGAGPAWIFATSFTSSAAHWRMSGGDWTCGAISAAAIVAYAATGKGWLAIALAITSDLAAALPTAAKAWHHPETENHRTFACSGIGAGLALLALPRWGITDAAFLAYVVIICAMITAFIVLPRLRPARHRAGSARNVTAAGAAVIAAAAAAVAVAVVYDSYAPVPGHAAVATGLGGVSSGPPRVGFVVAVLQSGQPPQRRRGREHSLARGPALVPAVPRRLSCPRRP
jgi:hypothetical protein